MFFSMGLININGEFEQKALSWAFALSLTLPPPFQVFQSLEDHHQEVVSFFQENGFHGLIAHDSEYALCNIPSYYSSHALKLSWNGKNLTTNQFLMQEVAKQLGLKLSSFPIFAALLGKEELGVSVHMHRLVGKVG